MRSFQVALVAALSVEATLAFTNPQTTVTSLLRSSQLVPSNGRLTTRRPVTVSTEDFNPQGLVPLKKETMLTPEGYGFTAPAKRILSEANRKGSGYYRAYTTDNIMSVINAITNADDYDAALVFDKETNKIVGLFTESDYIKVSAFACWLIHNVAPECLPRLPYGDGSGNEYGRVSDIICACQNVIASFLGLVQNKPKTKNKQQTFSFPMSKILSRQHQSCYPSVSTILPM